MGMFLSGCDSQVKTDEIKARAFPSGRELTLPYKGKINIGDFENSGGMIIGLDPKIDEQISTLEAAGDLKFHEVPGQGNAWLLVHDTANEKDLYVLTPHWQEGRLVHHFKPAKAYVVSGESNQYERRAILFPVHLVTDPRLGEIHRLSPELVRETEYEIEGMDLENVETFFEDTINAFKEFYELSGYYQVQREGDALILTPISKLIPFRIEFSYRYSNAYIRLLG